jgi:hypothetical protein
MAITDEEKAALAALVTMPTKVDAPDGASLAEVCSRCVVMLAGDNGMGLCEACSFGGSDVDDDPGEDRP